MLTMRWNSDRASCAAWVIGSISLERSRIPGYFSMMAVVRWPRTLLRLLPDRIPDAVALVALFFASLKTQVSPKYNEYECRARFRIGGASLLDS